MTGERLVELMQDKHLRREVHKAARRYTKCPEDIEEYMDDAWMRIAECHEDKTHEYYATQARKATKAAYDRKWRRVRGIVRDSANGIDERPISKRPPRDSVDLGRGRYLVRKREKLSSWYYDGEWKDYGVTKEGMQVFSFYEIVVMST